MKATNAGPGFFDYLNKALTPGATWEDKDDLLDVVYWGKQIFALVIGVIFGVLKMQGVFALISYVAITTGLFQQFVTKFHKVEEDEVGGFWELSKEGFGAAFATYMVSWITIYSALYAD